MSLAQSVSRPLPSAPTGPPAHCHPMAPTSSGAYVGSGARRCCHDARCTLRQTLRREGTLSLPMDRASSAGPTTLEPTIAHDFNGLVPHSHPMAPTSSGAYVGFGARRCSRANADGPPALRRSVSCDTLERAERAALLPRRRAYAAAVPMSRNVGSNKFDPYVLDLRLSLRRGRF